MSKITVTRVQNIFIALAVIFIVHPILALSNAEDTYCAQDEFNYSINNQVDLLKIGAHAFYAKEYTKTISICNQIILSSPDYAPAYVLKGLACSSKGEISAALTNLDRAISIDPNLASAWASKGVVLYSQNSVPDANTCIQRALDIDSNFSTKS
jgi:tetratricopeptide (TPR) repeat protein